MRRLAVTLTFGAVPGTRRGSLPTDGTRQTVYLAADLPGMNINFLDVDGKAGTETISACRSDTW